MSITRVQGADANKNVSLLETTLTNGLARLVHEFFHVANTYRLSAKLICKCFTVRNNADKLIS